MHEDSRSADKAGRRLFSRAAKYIIPDKFSFGSSKLILFAGGNGVGKTTLFNALDINHVINAREIQKRHAEIFGSDAKQTDDACKHFSYKLSYGKLDGIIKWSNAAFNMRLSHSDDDVLSSFQNFTNKWYTDSVSEGQALIQTIGQFFSSMRYYATHKQKQEDHSKPAVNEAKKSYAVLIDEIDSGLSIEGIDWAASQIKQAMKLYPNSQFFIFFNSYELWLKLHSAKSAITLSMYDGKKVSFDSYESYAKFIRSNQKKFCHQRFLDSKNPERHQDD